MGLCSTLCNAKCFAGSFKRAKLSILLIVLLLDSFQSDADFLATIALKHLRKHFPVLSSCMTYHQVWNKINTTGVTSRAGTAYLFGAPEFTHGFWWGSSYLIFSFVCMFLHRCLSFCTFSFGHCVVCSPSIYGF